MNTYDAMLAEWDTWSFDVTDDPTSERVGRHRRPVWLRPRRWKGER